eukprot:749656-Hanusia_phi.AAC.3
MMEIRMMIITKMDISCITLDSVAARIETAGIGARAALAQEQGRGGEGGGDKKPGSDAAGLYAVHAREGWTAGPDDLADAESGQCKRSSIGRRWRRGIASGRDVCV